MVDETYPFSDYRRTWTFFNDDFKHKKVEEFCVWYLRGNSDKVNITTVTKRRRTEEEKQRIRNGEDEHYDPSFLRRSPRVSSSPDGVTRKFEPLSEDWVTEERTDERFKNLKELVHRYADMTPDREENKEPIIMELYRLIMLLEEERRINGGVGFPHEPYNKSEMEQVRKELSDLANSISYVNRRVDSTNKLIKKALREGRIIK